MTSMLITLMILRNQNLIDKKICSIKALAYNDIWGEVDNLNDLIASENNLKKRNWRN